MQATKRLALAMLIVSGAGLSVPVLAADGFRIAANQTLTGKPDLDSHPGPGDTDINNDGRNDLDQLKQEAKSMGAQIDSQARDLGARTEVQLDRFGDKARQDFNQLGNEVKQIDLNDADDVLGPRWGTWLLLGLLALAVVGLLYAAFHRRRRFARRRAMY